MLVVYEPEMCKGQDAKFRGTVTLRLPSFDEFYQYMGEYSDNKKETSKDYCDLMRKMVSLSKPHYEKVDIELIEASKKYSSFDELAEDSRAFGILTDIAPKIIHGQLVGK